MCPLNKPFNQLLDKDMNNKNICTHSFSLPEDRDCMELRRLKVLIKTPLKCRPFRHLQALTIYFNKYDSIGKYIRLHHFQTLHTLELHQSTAYSYQKVIRRRKGDCWSRLRRLVLYGFGFKHLLKTCPNLVTLKLDLYPFERVVKTQVPK